MTNIKKLLNLIDKSSDIHLKKYLMQSYIFLILKILKNSVNVSDSVLEMLDKSYEKLRMQRRV